ncbi:MAG: 4-hydroxy-tetrahydrodipicolinate synthase [Holosporaceae bacterium]|jgi:4-hydroxy-tetrahydrodipicolinate synthase|nr:4-hydroxy-tetrahydrodipicolinate synthase [Holosporaceae bacterium]
MLTGYVAAVVSPFVDGKIDLVAFEKYVDHIISSGISGIAVCGSTGESLSLSMYEKIELIRRAAEVNAGRVQLIGGVVNSTTDDCLLLIRQTEKYVDYFLCVCPFYVKPSQQQIYNHFKILSEATSRKIILYNNPCRVGVNMEFDLFRRLCDIENVVALKECALDLSRFTLWRSGMREDFSFMAGNDDVACGALAMGAQGVISVSANVAPNLCVRLYNAFLQRNFSEFELIRDSLAQLHELMFTEPNPAPAKYALSRQGLVRNELRAPLSPIGDPLQKRIDGLMAKLMVI